MDRRYQKFREARAANLAAFNKKVGHPDRLPMIWLIHNEFAK